MRRFSILVLTVAATLLLPVLPAQAHAPRQSTSEADFTLRIHCSAGYRLVDQVHQTVHMQRFFNEDHKLVRTTVHFQWEGTITNKATGEFLAADPGHWQTTYVGKTATVTGLLFGIKISSLGILIQGVGRIVTNVRTGDVLFESSTDTHHQDYGDLCEALA